jgi:hypothetical protein
MENHRPHWSVRLLRPALILLGLIIVWRVLVVAANMLTADQDPLGTQTPLESTSQESFWRQRIARDPTDAYALLMLAAQFERSGERAQAREAVLYAMRQAPSDRRVLMEGAGFYLRTGDTRQALSILRRTVDLYPAASADVWPVFTSALDSGRYDDFFVELTRENPKWWVSFFQQSCATSTDVRRLQALFAERSNSQRVQPEERACLLARVQKEGRWAEAYQLWLNSLPAEQKQIVGNVFDGGFEWPISNIGFDWIVPAQEGVRAEIQPMEGARGKRALRVQFVEKRFAGSPIYQHLMLPPGRYRFEGQGRPEGLETWLGVQWGLYCLPESGKELRQLSRSDRFLGSSDWTPWRQDFVVPAGCPVQLLRLELANPRREADTPGNVAARLRGAVAFDDLKVIALD